MEDEMTPFLSEGDQMAAIINDEVRAIDDIRLWTYDDGTDANLFMLLVPYAEQDQLADLYYYNAKANQTYKLTTVDVRANNTLGSETDYIIGLFSYGQVMAKLGPDAPFAYTSGDQLGLFIDDACCGLGTYDATQQQWTLKVYNLYFTNTKAHFRYYSAEKKAIYKTSELIDLVTLPRAVLTPYYLEFL